MVKIKFALVFLGVSVFVVYLLTSGGNTPYNHFVLLADSFLKGKFSVTANAPWLEKVPVDENSFYIVNSPMPAVLLMPFVFFFGKNFPQQYIAHIAGGLLVVLITRLSYLVKKDIGFALWSGATFGFGSIIWFLSSVGSTWYLGQITACLFLTAALSEALSKKRVFLVGLFIGAAYLSRVHTILSLPLFIYLLSDNLKDTKRLLSFLAPLSVFVGFDVFYNLSRYGVFWNQGQFLIPKTANEPWFSKGYMHPSYILEDLKIAFLKLPIFKKEAPFIIPSWSGLAIWITTPAFLYSLRAKWNERLVGFLWFSILLIFLVVGLHGGTGFAQFGYRFAVDFYPFLILLTIKGATRSNLSWHHFLLLFLGILVNLWGVLWINKFGWVEY